MADDVQDTRQAGEAVPLQFNIFGETEPVKPENSSDVQTAEILASGNFPRQEHLEF